MNTLTEIVNPRIGSIRASGHLTVQGADLLRGTVEQLHRSGHSRVLLDMHAVQIADDAGLHVLSDAARGLAAAGGELLVRATPGGPAGTGAPAPARP